MGRQWDTQPRNCLGFAKKKSGTEIIEKILLG